MPISVASAQFNQKGGLKPIQTPPTQTPTPVGFASVLCVADGISGAALPTNTITLGGSTITGGLVNTANGISTITVTITNNTTSTSSQFVVTFIDNNTDNNLHCGDTIISVVPAS